jgi:hypothetical protein
MPKSLLLCLTIGLLLGGCASPTRIRSTAISSPLPAPQGYVALRQQEIKTSINRQDSSAISGQFGLIGSLVGSAIDASVNSKRGKEVENASTQVRNALLDYQPADHFIAAIRAQFAETGPVNLVVRRVSDPEEPKRWVEAAAHDTLLIDYDYTLSPAYNGVKVCALVTWHRPGANRPAVGMAKNLPPVIYQNVLSSVRYFPSLTGVTLAEKASEITADGAKVVREALDLAQADIAALLVYDLGVPERPDNALYKPEKSDIKRSIDINHFSRGVFLGRIERTTDDRVWIRSIMGDLGADVK